MGELSNTTINGVSYDFKDAGAARQSHSHTKSQITDFPTSMPASDVSAWAKAPSKPSYTASEVGAIATTAKGAASGVAELDANGKVPSSQLPSFVDDVLEYSAKSSFPATGETGKIYVDTSNNKTYRWSGSAYVEISPSLALGETSSTAYRGDRGKAAYDHSQTTSGNPHNTTASEVGAVPNTAAGVSAAINQLTTGDSAPTDNDYYVSQYAGGGTSTTTYHRRPVSKLWEYIRSKFSLSTTGSGNAVTGVSYSNGAFTVTKGSSFAASSHTHNYAGSSSAGGAATSANKLNTDAGSATQPVYFSNGVPVATTHPFFTIPINHNMIYRGNNLGATFTSAHHTALSSGNFTDLYLGDYWTKSVTIPAGAYKDGGGASVTVPAQTVTLKAVIADFDTFYAGYDSSYAAINKHHAAVIVTGFNGVAWNSTNTTAGGYLSSLIHKWLVGSALPQIETWFGSDKVLSHQKRLTNAITGDAASGWAWRSQKISLLTENQVYGSKVWGGSKATNGGYEPGEAFKHLNVFNHINANLLFENKSIWLRDIASDVGAANLNRYGNAVNDNTSGTYINSAALILLS